MGSLCASVVRPLAGPPRRFSARLSDERFGKPAKSLLNTLHVLKRQPHRSGRVSHTFNMQMSKFAVEDIRDWTARLVEAAAHVSKRTTMQKAARGQKRSWNLMPGAEFSQQNGKLTRDLAESLTCEASKGSSRSDQLYLLSERQLHSAADSNDQR